MAEKTEQPKAKNYNNLRGLIQLWVAERCGKPRDQVIQRAYYSYIRLQRQEEAVIDAIRDMDERGVSYTTDDMRDTAQRVLDEFDEKYGSGSFDDVQKGKAAAEPANDLESLKPTELRDMIEARGLSMPQHDLRSREFKAEAIEVLTHEEVTT